jgi:hypothetical protein
MRVVSGCRDRRNLATCVVVGALAAALPPLVACRPAASQDAASDTARIADLKLAPEAFHVDKVGGGDGSLDPDDVPDAVFLASIAGPALGLILVAKDEHGAPCAQWDTLTGQDTLPTGVGLYSTHGDTTAGIAVYEGDSRKTRSDGSLPPIAAGVHALTLYVEIRDVPQMKSVELLVQRVDGSIVHGPTLPLTLPAPPAGS